MRLLHLLFRKRLAERQLDKELRFHLEQQIDDHIAAGMTPEEARRRVRIEFGGLEQIKEECRDSRGIRWLDNLVQDIRYAVRMLRSNPSFASVAVLTLGLGLGVNTTLFTFLNAGLRPLPVRDPGQLVEVQSSVQREQGFSRPSYPDYLEIRDHSQAYSGVIAMTRASLTMGGARGEPQEPAQAHLVSGNYFSVLGVQAILGRALTPNDDRGLVAVLSYGFWQRRFHSDTGVLGKTLLLNFRPYTVIGVMPPEFIGTKLTSIDVWIPLTLDSEVNKSQVEVVGRLKPEINISRASAELSVISKRLVHQFPETNAASSFVLESASSLVTPSPYLTPLIATAMATVGLVLLIACANVANLLMARSVVRRKEIAARLALGAGRSRLVTQLLTESTLLALLGGGLGIVFAISMSRVVLREIVRAIPAEAGTFYFNIAPDYRVFLYAFLLSLATGIVFGLVPALQASKVDLASALKLDGASAGRQGRRSFFATRDLLVVVQVSVCLVLLIASGLAVRGLILVLTTDPGFQTSNMILLEFSPDRLGYDAPKTIAFERRLDARLKAMPGIESVSEVEVFPLVSQRIVPIDVPGRVARYNRVTANYFQTLRLPIVRGRTFSAAEMATGGRVMLVSESTARNLWPGQDPIGKCLGYGKAYSPPSEVIGVVRDARNAMLWQVDDLYLYLPLSSDAAFTESFLIRTRSDPKFIMGGIRSEVQALELRMPIFLHTMDQAIGLQVSIFRIAAKIAGTLGILALLLTAVGIYGLMAYTVTQRTREIGIRMALGAGRASMMRLVLGQSCKLVIIGAGIGLVGAVVFIRIWSSLLLNIELLDPLTFAAVTGFLFGIALLATYIPARRATRVDPMVALRYE